MEKNITDFLASPVLNTMNHTTVRTANYKMVKMLCCMLCVSYHNYTFFKCKMSERINIEQTLKEVNQSLKSLRKEPTC